MARSTQKPVRNSRKKIIFLASISIIFFGGFFASSQYAAPYLIQTSIRANGFPEAQVGSLSLTKTGAFIDHISLDRNGFSTFDDLSISFRWADLLLNQSIDSLQIKDISLSGEIDDNRIFKIAGWDASFPKKSNSPASFPFRSLLLDGVTLDVDTPEGNFRIQGKLHFDTTDTGSHPLNISLWAEQKQFSFSLNGSGMLFNNGDIEASLELLEGRAEFPDFNLSRLSGWSKISTKSQSSPIITGAINAGSIKVANALLQNVHLAVDSRKSKPFFLQTSPAGFPDISLTANWNTSPPEQMEVTVHSSKVSDLYKLFSSDPDKDILFWLKKDWPVTIQLAVPPSSFSFGGNKEIAWAVIAGESQTKIQGTAAYRADKNNVMVRVNPAEIPAKTLHDLFPIQQKLDLSLEHGSLLASGTIDGDIHDGGITLSGPVSIEMRVVGGFFSGVGFKNLNGQTTMSHLNPWKIDKPSSFTFSLVNQDGVFAEGLTSFNGSLKTGLYFSGTGFQVAKGTVSVADFSFSPNSSETKITASLSHLDVSALSKMSGTPSLTAQGSISGTIPIIIGKDGIRFQNGAITSDGIGYFKYHPDQFPSSLQGDDPRMKIVRDALSDFQFDRLSLNMSGPMNGTMITTFNANGISPALGERPITLNLNLEGDLGQVLQQILQTGDIAATLRSIKGD